MKLEKVEPKRDRDERITIIYRQEFVNDDGQLDGVDYLLHPNLYTEAKVGDAIRDTYNQGLIARPEGDKIEKPEDAVAFGAQYHRIIVALVVDRRQVQFTEENVARQAFFEVDKYFDAEEVVKIGQAVKNRQFAGFFSGRSKTVIPASLESTTDISTGISETPTPKS